MDAATAIDTGVAETGADAAPPCGNVVVNELMSEGASASDEFVELHNPNTCTAMLNGYKLMYSSSAGSTPSAIITFTTANTIPAGGYLVIVGTGFVGDAGSGAISTSIGLAAAAGRVGLLDPTAKVVDAVAYGTITGPATYVEGTPAPSPPAMKSIGRKPNGTDTDNNSVRLPDPHLADPGHAN